MTATHGPSCRAIGKVEVSFGKEAPQRRALGGHTDLRGLDCDHRPRQRWPRVFSSKVCMAIAPAAPEKAPSWADDHVLLAPEAQERLSASEIWYHLGGWSDEGDTYETQEWQFQEELDRFWMQLIGPDEQLRRSILDALQAHRAEMEVRQGVFQR